MLRALAIFNGASVLFAAQKDKIPKLSKAFNSAIDKCLKLKEFPDLSADFVDSENSIRNPGVRFGNDSYFKLNLKLVFLQERFGGFASTGISLPG